MTAPAPDPVQTTPRPRRRWLRRAGIGHRRAGRDCRRAGGAAATPAGGDGGRPEAPHARPAQSRQPARGRPGLGQLPPRAHPGGRAAAPGRARAGPSSADCAWLPPAAAPAAGEPDRRARGRRRPDRRPPAGRAAGTCSRCCASRPTRPGAAGSRSTGFACATSSVAAELAPDSVARLRVQEFLAARPGRRATRRWSRSTALELAVQPPRSSRWLALATRGGVTANEIRLDPLRIHTESSELTGRLVVPRSFGDAAAGGPARRPARRPAARPGGPRGLGAVGAGRAAAPLRRARPRARATWSPRTSPRRSTAAG